MSRLLEFIVPLSEDCKSCMLVIYHAVSGLHIVGARSPLPNHNPMAGNNVSCLSSRFRNTILVDLTQTSKLMQLSHLIKDVEFQLYTV